MTRVAITTDRFDVAAAPFARLGMEPLPTPCIRVEPAGQAIIDQARESAAGADLLILTSVRTVELLWPHAMPDVDVAAVGGRTASAVKARGGNVVVVGQSGLRELANTLVPLLSSSRVSFPHAAGSIPDALARVREESADLTEFEVYTTIPVAPPSTLVDAVAFTSPTAVKGWMLTRALDGLVVAAIGPTTAEALAPFRAPDVVAEEPSHAALARAVAEHMEVTV